MLLFNCLIISLSQLKKYLVCISIKFLFLLRFSYINTDKAPPGFKWIDNKNCIFKVELEAISSVHTENPELDTFLHKTAGLQLGQKPARMSDKDMEVDLGKISSRAEFILKIFSDLYWHQDLG